MNGYDNQALSTSYNDLKRDGKTGLYANKKDKRKQIVKQ